MHVSPLINLFVQVAVIIALGRVMGLVFSRFRQPQLVGEILAGIMLGPSLLGWLWPAGFAMLFPADSKSIEYLNLLSQVGVVFFLFLIGMELDPRLIFGRGRAAAVVSGAGIVVPFVLGVGLVVYLYPRVFDGSVRLRSAALFMGAAISVTAFPVLARILTERHLHRTEVGGLAIACAAINDVAAWCMLAFVVAVARSRGMGHILVVAALSGVYLAVMFLVVRPFLSRLEIVYERQGRLSQNLVAIIFLLIMISAYTTEAIGIHALLGAFLMGWIMPKGTQFVRHLSEKLEDYTVVLLLPVFFAYTGLRTDVGLLRGGHLWGYTLLVIVVACAGKIGGVTLACRWTRMPWRDAAAVGVLMNTRGLMGLILLDVGLRIGVITPAVFAMMVVMAVVTTGMTTPLLHWIYPLRYLQALGSSARTVDTTKSSAAPGISILIPVSLPKSGAPLVQLADALIGHDKDHSRLLAIHLRRPVDHEAYRSGLDEAAQSHDESLAPLLAQARGRMIPVEQISFVSIDVSGDICTCARLNNVNLVLMGFHKPVIGKTILGGTVHRVLQHCDRDVAVFVDRGFRSARRILVPYLGSVHDKLALELAHRMARHTEAQVTVLQIVAPMRNQDGEVMAARQAVDRAFHEPGQKTPVTFRVIEDESPVGVVLHQSQNADLVIIGVAEEWGLESHLFGWRAQRVARDCPSSLLIVRKAETRGNSPETATAGEARVAGAATS
jgi:Kef-type K+ transport system membrane component KefB